MSAAALLTHLEAAGVQITREGQALRVRCHPAANPSAYREVIAASKPTLLRELLQREVVAAASADPQHFDREHYDDLWQQWRALPDTEAEAAALVPQLGAGWDWLAAHPDHSEHDAFFERWLDKLHAYEQTLCHTHAEEAIPVEARTPPVDWTGIAPGGCGVPHICTALGPCPQFTMHGRCWTETSP